jgi:Acetyltransferase (GNAT) family
MHQIREATANDNQALLELECKSPLDLGHSILAFDRAPNYFAHQEMQEHGRVVVAEEDGRLVGVVAGALHDALIGGNLHRLLYIHQGRVLPEYRRRSIGTELVIHQMVLAADARFNAPYWLISPDNDTSLAFNRQVQVESWPVDGRLDAFDVAARSSATREVGSVGPDDLSEVVALINRTHAGRQMFLPYDIDALERRLSLSRNYGWQQWRGYRSKGKLIAAAGVWDFGRSLCVTEREKATGIESTARPAYVLDYGYAEGAEEAMAEVFVTLMAMAAECERDRLSIALPVESRLFSLMAPLPHSTTLLQVLTPGIVAPKVSGSVYLDPVYV